MRDFLQVFGLTLASFLALYMSDFGLLQKPFLVAFMGYLGLVFVIGVVLLKSFRLGAKAAVSALVTVSFLALIHVLSFPSYDPIAPVAYFLVLLLAFLISLYVLYARFLQNRPLFRVYEESKLSITFIVVSTILVGLIVASMELLEQFGVLTMVGAALSYLTMLFYLAPLVRLEEAFKASEKLSSHEKKVKHYVRRYGKNKELHPFYAAWLGSAVQSIEDYIDSLEAKGHLGHNFFSVQNFLMWFMAPLSFLLGVESAKGTIIFSLIPFVVLMVGVLLVAPQTFMKRRVRRLSGLLLLIASLGILYFWGNIPLKFGMYSVLTALVAIYFAYSDDEVISMVFSSFFTGSLFILGYSLWKIPVVLTAAPWVITATIFALLNFEYYIEDRDHK